MGKDGLLHCSVCGEPTQKILPFPLMDGSEGTRDMKVHIMCSCEKKERDAYDREQKRQEEMRVVEGLRKLSLMDDKLSQARLESFTETDDNARLLKIVRNYIVNFEKMYEDNQGLLLWGPVGTGKSYAAAVIANELLDRRTSVVMTSFIKILEGKMTITIDVSFTEETVQNRDPNIEGDMRIVHTPKFQHKVGSVLQIKNEQKGDMNCDGMEMIWDNEKGEYVLRPITGRDQMSIFDMEVQNAQESATDAEVVEGEVLEGRKIPALPMNEPEDDESDGSPEDGPQDEEDMSDEFGDDYGYDDPEEY